MKWNKGVKISGKEFVKIYGILIIIVFVLLIGAILMIMFWPETVKALTEIGAIYALFWVILFIVIIIKSIIKSLKETHKKSKTED